ncbi:TRAP transporter small permease [Devosia sp. Root635]|uniref:TRAP transporter small permease n=1 Tax=Devosia sp. Root635 TaxID=1736575 RepID=UPI0006F7C59B|nr:TRAP transporter small permease [Devosia sp. Root635]KRA47205.1 hypothetical protein ASD80_17965 [Devosia sp. Root635]
MIDRMNLWLARLCAIVAGTALVIMMLVAFVDSVGRKLNHPLHGAEEYVTFTLLTFFFAAIPLVVQSNGHIRVGLFTDAYAPALKQAEKYFTAVVELLCLAGLTWMIFDQADRLARFGTLSVHFLMPVAPWVYAAAILTLTALVFMAFNVWNIFHGRDPQPSHDRPE